MSINREWHEKHRMPKNPTKEQRIEWHIGHAKNCNCREAPEWVKAEIKKKRQEF